ncbi:hypothetical protein ACSBR2_009754 [Camellia fascicularis]
MDEQVHFRFEEREAHQSPDECLFKRKKGAFPLTDAPMTALTENHAILPSSGGMERITGNCLLTKKEDIKS